MSRKLKKLRVTEISAVTRGAGEGVRILLCKRADGSTRQITLPAAVPSSEEITKMNGSKQIIKRAASHGDIDQNSLMQAVQKRASREHPEAPTEAIAFSRYVTANPEVLQILKSAPAGPPKPQATTSFGILAEQALDECRKKGVPLPSHSPYRPYLLEKAALQGERDQVDPVYGQLASKAVLSVAEGLVANGRFSDIETAIRYMRSSPAYAGMFSAAGKYREAVGSMISSTEPR